MGAVPIGATNCLNFGNPEKPEIMWQFARAVDGMRDACERFGVPITGGNVSFYNETEGEGIDPTPVVGLVGLLEDRSKLVRHHVRQAGNLIYLLGDTGDQLGGSEFLKVLGGRRNGRPPALDLDAEASLQAFARAAGARRLLQHAHDLSDGGLAVGVAECLFGPLGETMGATISLEAPRRAEGVLFSETPGRMLVSVRPGDRDAIEALAEDHGVPFSRIGVTGGETLEIQVNGERAVSRDARELREAWWTAIEKGLAP